MLIGAGWAKGLKLKTPKGESTRPTAARVRGAVLNMLQPRLDGALVLDLFAGSGAMGIEAVSRGARGAVFVERSKGALDCLRQNAAELARRAAAQDLGEVALAVVGRDVGQALGELERRAPFDVIFVDPPYRDAAAWAGTLLAPLAPLTSTAGVLLLESGAADAALRRAAGTSSAGWRVVKQRVYGDTMVTLFEKEIAPE